jgi:hypothetical protein
MSSAAPSAGSPRIPVHGWARWGHRARLRDQRVAVLLCGHIDALLRHVHPVRPAMSRDQGTGHRVSGSEALRASVLSTRARKPKSTARKGPTRRSSPGLAMSPPVMVLLSPIGVKGSRVLQSAFATPRCPATAITSCWRNVGWGTVQDTGRHPSAGVRRGVADGGMAGAQEPRRTGAAGAPAPPALVAVVCRHRVDARDDARRVTG